ncbi:ATP-binding protein [Paenibacillus sp. MBLB4367]|uniref:ATP-binding protein n=1 Tax=Paenibacillus sp. MBLB4367 TaxID=3384767 RepID=UPI0039083EB0
MLDLSEWVFTEDGNVKLAGDWEFYWERLLEPADFTGGRKPEMTGYISIPHSWNGYPVKGEPLPGLGFATFRLTVSIDGNAVNSELALKLPTIFHAYKLWVGDELIASVGQVGSSREKTVPSLATRVVTFKPEKASVQLVLQVANFHHLRGGVTKYMALDTADRTIHQASLKIALDMFVTGSLIMIGVYHLFLFARRSKDRAPFYFGLFCLIWGVRSLLVGEVMLTKLFPAFPWEAELKLEYLAQFAGTYIFTMYIRSMYPKETPSFVYRISGLTTGAFSLLTMATPARVYTQALVGFQWIAFVHLAVLLAIIATSVARRREGSVLLLVASVVAFLTALNDYLFYGEKLLIGNLSPLGLLLFTFAQAYLLSARFSAAFSEVEQLSRELQTTNEQLAHLNKNLEGVVAKRTQQISEAHDHLSRSFEEQRRAEEARRRLLAYVTHDLRTPVGIVIGYAEAIQDGVYPERNDSYLKLIHNKAVRINRMLEDLYDLSQLESRLLTLDLHTVQASSYMQDIRERYEWEVSRSGLLLLLEQPAAARHEAVRMDPDRIERVFANLIGNAQKFTPSGGSITLSWREDDRGGFLFQVKDTGFGIGEEELPHLFERNGHKRRVPAREQEGSGLGLAICKEIVEMHGGAIWAESAEGEGSTFRFTLPATGAMRGRGESTRS